MGVMTHLAMMHDAQADAGRGASSCLCLVVRDGSQKRGAGRREVCGNDAAVVDPLSELRSVRLCHDGCGGGGTTMRRSMM